MKNNKMMKFILGMSLLMLFDSIKMLCCAECFFRSYCPVCKKDAFHRRRNEKENLTLVNSNSLIDRYNDNRFESITRLKGDFNQNDDIEKFQKADGLEKVIDYVKYENDMYSELKNTPYHSFLYLQKSSYIPGKVSTKPVYYILKEINDAIESIENKKSTLSENTAISQEDKAKELIALNGTLSDLKNVLRPYFLDLQKGDLIVEDKIKYIDFIEKEEKMVHLYIKDLKEKKKILMNAKDLSQKSIADQSQLLDWEIERLTNVTLNDIKSEKFTAYCDYFKHLAISGTVVMGGILLIKFLASRYLEDALYVLIGSSFAFLEKTINEIKNKFNKMENLAKNIKTTVAHKKEIEAQIEKIKKSITVIDSDLAELKSGKLGWLEKWSKRVELIKKTQKEFKNIVDAIDIMSKKVE